MLIDWRRGAVVTGLGAVMSWSGGNAAAAATQYAFQPTIIYDVEQAERDEQERLREEAQLVQDILDQLGPSKELIDNSWMIALMQLDDMPSQTIGVEYDIDDATLLRLTKKHLEIGTMGGEQSGIGTIKSPDSTVTFAKSDGGWMFFRTKGTA